MALPLAIGGFCHFLAVIKPFDTNPFTGFRSGGFPAFGAVFKPMFLDAGHLPGLELAFGFLVAIAIKLRIRAVFPHLSSWKPYRGSVFKPPADSPSVSLAQNGPNFSLYHWQTTPIPRHPFSPAIDHLQFLCIPVRMPMQARPIQQSIPIRTLASAGPILVPPPFLTVFFAIHKFGFPRLPIGIVPVAFP